MNQTNKVDIVYTWVDGNDQNWIRKKKSFIKNNPDSIQHIRANSNERFFNNDELKYSLRSVEKYAKWIKNIYIITDNQKPEWLNTKNQKIKLIDHKEIFDEKYLPCFNSSAIETNLHKIRELNNYFLFFNDDLFLGRKTTKEDFFHNNCNPKLFSSKNNISIQDLEKKERENEFQYAIYNSRLLIYKKYNYFSNWNLRHGIKVLDKNTLIKLEEKFSNYFKETRKNRFRNSNDIHVMSLYAYYLVAKNINNQFYMPPIRKDLIRYKINYFRKGRDYTYVPLNLPMNKITSKFAAIKKYKPLMFCVNDGPNVDNNKRKIAKNKLKELFPNKSMFEK